MTTTNSASKMKLTRLSDREIELQRVFDAPRALVFEALLDPNAVPLWWGPRYLTTRVETLDARPGGRWRFLQQDAAGNEYGFHGEYRQITPPEQVVQTFEFEGMPGHVVEETMTLEEHDGGTLLKVRSLFASPEDLNGMLQSGMEAGAAEGYDRLEELLRTRDREIVLTRSFDAPRDLLFTVWTQPEHVAQWWGPRGFTTTNHQMDVRPGGVWRLTMHGPDGTDYPNQIVYREVVRPERLVYSHASADPNDPGRFDVTVTFTEMSGKTVITMRSLFQSAEARDYVVREFHAIEGGNQTLDRLGAYLATMR